MHPNPGTNGKPVPINHAETATGRIDSTTPEPLAGDVRCFCPECVRQRQFLSGSDRSSVTQRPKRTPGANL